MEKYINMAKDRTAKARGRKASSGDFYIPVPEQQSYCLFVAANDGIFPVGYAPTVSDFAPLIAKANLKALAAKYKADGFVVKRTPKQVSEWSFIPASKGSK